MATGADMRAHFPGYRAHYQLWVHLSQHKHLKWLPGADMTAHFHNFGGNYRLWVHLSQPKHLNCQLVWR